MWLFYRSLNIAQVLINKLQYPSQQQLVIHALIPINDYCAIARDRGRIFEEAFSDCHM